MRLSIASTPAGPLADAAAVRATALAAEAVGYSGLWVLDRPLPPLGAGTGGEEQGTAAAPAPQEQVLDPLGVVATAAAVTTRLRLGTSLAAAAWCPPPLLVHALTTLDVLSDGRLTLALGTGGPLDGDGVSAECADGADGGLGAGGPRRPLDDLLDAIDARWGGIRPVGSRAPAHPGTVDDRLQPIQHPRPPVLLAAHTPAAFDRVARRADGWLLTDLALHDVSPTWHRIRTAATAAGRDATLLTLAVRAGVTLTDRPLATGRPPYTGSVDQVVDDLLIVGRLGAHEVILALAGAPVLDEMLDSYARVAEAFELRRDEVVRAPTTT